MSEQVPQMKKVDNVDQQLGAQGQKVIKTENKNKTKISGWQ